MIKHPNDHNTFGKKIASLIDEQPLSYRQAERLRAARQLAMERSRVQIGALALAGDWLQRQFVGAQHMRRNLAFVLLFGIAIAAWWQLQPDFGPEDEVDAMLLADELPPDAYLSEQADRLTQGS
ncbi:DUF3619 family protein [Chitinimonas sp.]|uniref:DUF3619 family protein n=1 Tax=Chitinimonas sp. TaxID=1934313 RepID=UPI0035B432CA